MSQPPDYQSLKTFGCLCYKSTSVNGRTKFASRAKACVFLGYPASFKGYKVLDLETNSISVSRHVIFHENIFPFTASSLSESVKAFFPSLASHNDCSQSVTSSSGDTLPMAKSPSDVSLPLAATSPRLRTKPKYLQDYMCQSIHYFYPLNAFLSYHKLSPIHLSFINSIIHISEPLSYFEATKFKEWCDAMDAEYDSLEGLDTWIVCSLPEGKTPVGCKWVFKLKLNPDGGDLLLDAGPYRRLVGKLMYLTITRPDICFAVNKLCQYSAAPRKPHLAAVHKVLHYLKGSIGKGLFYPADDEFQIKAFCDADLQNCLDTRRSVTGSCIFIGDSLVSWKAKKQDVVSLSSAESEYRAMSDTAKEVVWLSRLLTDLKVSSPLKSVLYCDSTAALHIAKNPVFHERTKHIESQCHSVQEKVEASELTLLHVCTTNQLADAFTKPLYPTIFQRLMSKMGLINILTPS